MTPTEFEGILAANLKLLHKQANMGQNKFSKNSEKPCHS